MAGCNDRVKDLITDPYDVAVSATSFAQLTGTLAALLIAVIAIRLPAKDRTGSDLPQSVLLMFPMLLASIAAAYEYGSASGEGNCERLRVLTGLAGVLFALSVLGLVALMGLIIHESGFSEDLHLSLLAAHATIAAAAGAGLAIVTTDALNELRIQALDLGFGESPANVEALTFVSAGVMLIATGVGLLLRRFEVLRRKASPVLSAFVGVQLILFSYLATFEPVALTDFLTDNPAATRRWFTFGMLSAEFVLGVLIASQLPTKDSIAPTPDKPDRGQGNSKGSTVASITLVLAILVGLLYKVRSARPQ